MLEPTYTPEQIADALSISYHGVLREIRSGKLRAAKIGKGYHVRQSWYDAWLEQNIVTPLRPVRAAPVAPRKGPAPVGSIDDLDAIEREEERAA